MKKFVVKLNLRKKSVDERIEYARHVITSMTGNIHFTTPVPALSVIKSVTDALEIAFIAAAGGSILSTSLLHEAIDDFDIELTALRHYVDNTARGSESVILSAGMETKRGNASVGIPTRVTGLQATSIGSGEIVLRWSPVKGKLLYLGYIKADGESDEQYKLVVKSARAKYTMRGLESGRKYWFVVEAVGSAGTGALSDVGTSFVL
jgi:hypothetical protein